MARAHERGRARPRLRGGRPRPSAHHVLGRRADARLAGARAQRRSRPDPARRADEPPRRREPRVAGARAAVARRRRHPRRARPLVPRGGHERDARAGGGPRDVLRRPLARVAAREGAARGARAEDGRPDRGRHRAPQPLRRTLPLQEGQGEAGAGEADADRPAEAGALRGDRRGRAALAPHALARLRVPEAGAERTHRRRGRRRLPLGGQQAPARRHDVRARARRARRARSARTARARRRCSRRCSASASRERDGSGSVTASRPRTSRSRRSSSTSAAPCSSASRR